MEDIKVENNEIQNSTVIEAYDKGTDAKDTIEPIKPSKPQIIIPKAIELPPPFNKIDSPTFLSEKHQFTYSTFVKKRYFMPKFTYRDRNYFGICNNGYIKLRTDRGNCYWLTQNENEHRSPDWKFHVSVNNLHLGLAWNLVSSIFLSKCCWEGVKCKYLSENTQTKRGREITLYIFQYDPVYNSDFDLLDERSENFWYDVFVTIEETLARHNIREAGCAIGDLKLGRYVSLRNEAYVMYGDNWEYPRDYSGWNAANHRTPFNIERFKKNSEFNVLDYIYLLLKIILISVIWIYIGHVLSTTVLAS